MQTEIATPGPSGVNIYKEHQIKYTNMGKMGIKKIKKYPPVASIAHSVISKARDRDIPISTDHYMKQLESDKTKDMAELALRSRFS